MFLVRRGSPTKYDLVGSIELEIYGRLEGDGDDDGAFLLLFPLLLILFSKKCAKQKTPKKTNWDEVNMIIMPSRGLVNREIIFIEDESFLNHTESPIVI